MEHQGIAGLGIPGEQLHLIEHVGPCGPGLGIGRVICQHHNVAVPEIEARCQKMPQTVCIVDASSQFRAASPVTTQHITLRDRSSTATQHGRQHYFNIKEYVPLAQTAAPVVARAEQRLLAPSGVVGLARGRLLMGWCRWGHGRSWRARRLVWSHWSASGCTWSWRKCKALQGQHLAQQNLDQFA